MDEKEFENKEVSEDTENLVKTAIEKINESMKIAPKIKKQKKELEISEKSEGPVKDISTIVSTLKASHFTIQGGKTFTNAVESLGSYLGTNDLQTVIFASMFSMYFENCAKPVSFYSMANYYECGTMTILQYTDVASELEEKFLLTEEDDFFFSVPKQVARSIIANDYIPTSDEIENMLRETESDSAPSPLIEKEPEILDIIKSVNKAFKENWDGFGAKTAESRKLAEYLGVPEESAMLFSLLFEMNNDNVRRPVSIFEINKVIRCEVFDMLDKVKRTEYLDPLLKKRILDMTDYSDYSVRVANFVEDAILHNRPLPENGSDAHTNGILSKISTIVVTLKKMNFSIDSWVTLDEPAAALCEYLGTEDKITALIFASLFTMYYDNLARPISFHSLSDFYQCNPLVVLQYREKMKWIVEKGYVEETPNPDDSSAAEFYTIPDFVSEAIINNTPIPALDRQKTRNINTFIHQIEKIGDRRIDSGSKIQVLYDEIERKEREHKNVASLEEVKKVLPNMSDRALFYDVAAGMLNHMNSEVEVMILVNRNSDEATGRQYIIDSFMSETNTLFTRELLQFENKASMMDSTVSLTDKAFDLLLGESEGRFYHKKISDKQMKSPDKIQEKELFYMPENEKEIKKLYDSFGKENLKNLQARLEEKKLPKGICVMFYGEPGTGKTETVYQMAKKTGRPVFHVDIGSMRSQWYGETEQKFSKLFNDYRKMCESAAKNDELLPILLFNEADAIFGKRVENAQNGGRVDNTIQNILLEEMERLPGILIATTNIEGNLDKAFERRFLFKIKFAKPNLEIKAKIWKSNIDWLSEDEATKLAAEFPFSGGEIANVVRKITMDEILSGERTPFEQIVDYCKTEKIQSGGSTVGFKGGV